MMVESNIMLLTLLLPLLGQTGSVSVRSVPTIYLGPTRWRPAQGLVEWKIANDSRRPGGEGEKELDQTGDEYQKETGSTGIIMIFLSHIINW